MSSIPREVILARETLAAAEMVLKARLAVQEAEKKHGIINIDMSSEEKGYEIPDGQVCCVVITMYFVVHMICSFSLYHQYTSI